MRLLLQAELLFQAEVDVAGTRQVELQATLTYVESQMYVERYFREEIGMVLQGERRLAPMSLSLPRHHLSPIRPNRLPCPRRPCLPLENVVAPRHRCAISQSLMSMGAIHDAAFTVFSQSPFDTL